MLITVALDPITVLTVETKDLRGRPIEASVRLSSRYASEAAHANAQDPGPTAPFLNVLNPKATLLGRGRMSFPISQRLPYLLQVSAFGFVPKTVSLVPDDKRGLDQTVEVELEAIVVAGVARPRFDDGSPVLYEAAFGVFFPPWNERQHGLNSAEVTPSLKSTLVARLRDREAELGVKGVWWCFATEKSPDHYPVSRKCIATCTLTGEKLERSVTYRRISDVRPEELLSFDKPVSRSSFGTLRIGFADQEGRPTGLTQPWQIEREGAESWEKRLVAYERQVDFPIEDSEFFLPEGEYVIRSGRIDERFGEKASFTEFEPKQVYVPAGGRCETSIVTKGDGLATSVTFLARDTHGRRLRDWSLFLMKADALPAWKPRAESESGLVETRLTPGTYKAFAIAFGYEPVGKLLTIPPPGMSGLSVDLVVRPSDSGGVSLGHERWIEEVNRLASTKSDE